jgi:hypothetical protein
LIKYLHASDRVQLADYLKDKLKSSRQLCEIVSHLDNDHQADYVLSSKHLIHNGQQLAGIIKVVTDSNQKVMLVMNMFKRIQGGSELIDILEYYPKDHRSTLVMQARHLIINGIILAGVLSFLPADQRFLFALLCRAAIQNDKQLIAVVNQLHTNEGLHIVRLIKSDSKMTGILKSISKTSPLESSRFFSRPIQQQVSETTNPSRLVVGFDDTN